MGGGMNQMQQQYPNRYTSGGWNNPSGGNYPMSDSMMPYQQQQQAGYGGYNQAGYGGAFNQGFKKPAYGAGASMGYSGASGPRRG